MIVKAAKNENSNGAALRTAATETLRAMRTLNAEQQCQAGEFVLRQAFQGPDEKSRKLAAQALEIMGKFPNFPRPRAAVVIRALSELQKA